MLDKLKAALGRDPWDQALRLIYADCLEEHGEPDAAQEQRQAASKKPRRPAKGPAPEGRETPDICASNTVYRRLRKRTLRRCDVCARNRGCNAGQLPAHSSWKDAREHQWWPR